MREHRLSKPLTSVALSLTITVGALLLWPVRSVRAIINGRPDTSNLYPYVGLVTDGMFVCSGAAISPTRFVTAAHCFETPGQTVSVIFDQQGLFAQHPSLATGAWHPDPNFCIGCGPGLPGFDQHDVAVVVFDQPVSLSRYAQLPTLGLAKAQPMKTEVKIVGYGIQDRLRRLDPGELFTRYFAPSLLIQSNHSFGDEFLKLSANASQGKGGICFGDSGGPVLLGNTDVILANNSFVTNQNCAGVTHHYRIDTPEALTFINQFLAQ